MIALLSFIVIQSCDKDEQKVKIDHGIELEQRTIDAFKALDLAPKNQDVELIVSDDETWTFRLTTPTNNDASKKPLVIALHWAGGETDFATFAACLAQAGLDTLGGYIITPSANSLDWKDAKNEKKVLSLISLAKSNLNIDADKVVIVGYSNGGIATWYYIDKFPDLFSCAIPMASVNRGGPVKKFDVPLYVIHGENDDLFPIATTKAYVDEIVDLGSDVTFVQADGLTHYDGCAYDGYLSVAAKWVFDVWDK